ncbi:uncharacterized protein LOC113215548 [Frankliniella occidentalis]|uniref:Uncharacterized protein LOC113215548 n=1 Tax=Frankliniella occidentalis TaxID=133901 RepID=A0A6J1TGW7_FRAOC|nr:uncharacterized protein LOC113215548 [Frankliniella occidentalis]
MSTKESPADASLTEENTGIKSILEHIKKLDNSLNAKLDSHTSSLKDLQSGVNDIKLRVCQIEKKTEDHEERICMLEERNSILEKELEKCQTSINHMNEYNRKNTVEIFGVPATRDENLFEIIKDIGRVCNVSIETSNIDAIHRDPRKIINPIVVKFVQREKCNELKAGRHGKKIMANQIGFEGNSRIYINVLLTKEKSHLAYQTRSVMKNLFQVKAHVWVDDASRIWVRKSSQDPNESNMKYEIKTDRDINRVASELEKST